jgi:hypothetical protein
MIETYKILNNIDKVQYEKIFPLNQTTTRGHSKKLYKKNCRTNVRKYGFMLYIFNQFGGSSLNIFQLYGFFFVYHWPYTAAIF